MAIMVTAQVIRATNEDTGDKTHQYEIELVRGSVSDWTRRVFIDINTAKKLRISAKKPGPVNCWYYCGTEELSL